MNKIKASARYSEELRFKKVLSAIRNIYRYTDGQIKKMLLMYMRLEESKRFGRMHIVTDLVEKYRP